jgi:hypothetical protein
MDFVIITAANDSYINTVINFIECYHIDHSKLIIYDLGFNQDNLEKILSLQNKFNFSLKKFHFNDYPEHVDVNKYYGLNCSYAFKPIILYNEANNSENKDKIIIWMDSANRFNQISISSICNIVKEQGIYSPISANPGTIEAIELNHHTIVKFYGITSQEHHNNLKSVSANLIGIDYSSDAGFNILNKWYQDSLNRNLILPDGINRNNNRQDQTLLSIIIYLYEKQNHINFNYTNFGVEFWKKADKSTIDNKYIPFKLIKKSNNQQLAIIYCTNMNEAILTYANRKNIPISDFLTSYSVKS